VRIYERDDGLFAFDEAYRVKNWPGEQPCWGLLPAYSSFCDNAETAEREALATIAWLREAQSSN
jgi:hypothetical protein